MDHFPNFRGENEKYLKPPSSFGQNNHQPEGRTFVPQKPEKGKADQIFTPFRPFGANEQPICLCLCLWGEKCNKIRS